jgi:hypothetical protein
MDPVIAEQLGRAHRSPAISMTSSPTWPTPAPPPTPGAAREVPLVVVEHVRRCLELGGDLSWRPLGPSRDLDLAQWALEVPA